MSRSEVASGNTTLTPAVVRERSRILIAVAGTLWLATIIVILTDVAMHDRLPNGVGLGLAVLAGTATLTAVALWTASLVLARLDELVEPVEAELGRTQAAITEALEVLALQSKVPGAVAARVQQHVPTGRGEPRLDASAYWAVYTDVLRDLAGLGGGDERPATN